MFIKRKYFLNIKKYITSRLNAMVYDILNFKRRKSTSAFKIMQCHATLQVTAK